MGKIYLDNAATTKPEKKVIDAAMSYLTEQWQNPSSLYSDGIKAKMAVEDARGIVGEFIGAKADEIYFVSSGSEANCWAIQGFVNSVRKNSSEPFIITTKIEHHSIMECTKSMKELGHSVAYIDVNEHGFVDTDQLIDALEWGLTYVEAPENILVSVAMANNEIGTIQDIKTISGIVHEYRAKLHCDAVQAFGHILVNVGYLNIDMLSASGHKIGAVRGTGILYKKSDMNIEPIIYGSQMNGLRGGTEDTFGIAAFAEAVELAKQTVADTTRISLASGYLIDKLEAIGCELNGDRDYRLPNNINVILPEGVGGEEMMLSLDLAGIECSTGSACNSRMKEPSYVLKAIGLSDEECARSIRLTIPNDISFGDIDKVVDEIERCIKLIKGETITWNGWGN